MAQKEGAIEWYRVKIPREELKKLTRRSDVLALAQSVGFLLVLVATGTASWIAWEASEAGTFPSDIEARWVKFHATTNYGAQGNLVGLSEVRFHALVPEPASLTLLSVGGLLILRRRQRG